MEDSFEIKPLSPSEPIARFGMTKSEQADAVKKMKQDNDIKTKH